MKKWIVLILLGSLLSGCAAPTFETLGDISHEQVLAPVPKEIVLSLPKDASVEAMNNEQTAYACKNYSICMQTMEAGDLYATVKALSGFSPDKLTIMESKTDTLKRYDFTWTAAGASGDLVFRAAVMDDGEYHYCVTAMAEATDMAGLMDDWNTLFASMEIA